MITQDVVPLANANANQITSNGVKGDWAIRENITDRELATFNARISDEDMFAILHFAREYELAAFNAGVDFQREKQNSAHKIEVTRLILEQGAMIKRNNELAEAVDRLTRGEN